MQHADVKKFDTFDASKLRVGVVRACFNNEITTELTERLLKKATEYSINKDNITVKEVPGSVELPVVLQNMAKSNKYDVLVAVGCVIRGETPHFEYVCKIASEGILRVMLDFEIPIGFGIITVNTVEQALVRLDAGEHALVAALQSYKAMY